jgi:hypothetical protein
MELTVYIPTRGRVGLSIQVTLRELRAFSSVKPWLVCPESEVAQHLRYHDQVLACPATNINQTHEWILSQATGGILTLDDDQYFSFRPTPSEPRPLERIKNLDPMFQWVKDQLDAGFIHGGISARQGNQHIPRPWADCIRQNNAHFFNADVFKQEGIVLPGEPNSMVHDFYFTLALLLRGYPNRVAYHYCWSQRGSGAKGGCSTYRTHDLQRTWCENLHAAFPEFVKLVTKTNVSGGSVFAGERVDVNIAWLKAWAARQPTALCQSLPQPEINLSRR